MSKLRINELESLETGRSLKVDEMAQTFDYEAGIKITSYNQMVRDDNGEFWRVSGSTVLPYVTTGSGLPEGDALVPAGDAVLRQDLTNPDKGAAMVGYGEGTVGDRLGTIITISGNGEDLTQEVQEALDSLPVNSTLRFKGSFKVNGGIILNSTSNVTLDLRAATFHQQKAYQKTLALVNCESCTVVGGAFYGMGGAAGEFDNNSTSWKGVAGIFLDSCNDIEIRGARLYDHAGSSIYWRDSSGLHIHHNKIVGIGPDYINPVGNGHDFAIGGLSDDFARMDFVYNIHDNDISGTAFGIFTNRTKSLRIHDNYIHDIPGQHGIYLIDCSGVSITNNIIRDVEVFGGKLQLENYVERGWAPGSDPNMYGLIVQGNTFINCDTSFATPFAGSIPNALEMVVGVRFEGNTSINSRQDGFRLERCINAVCSNNTIIDATRFALSWITSSGVISGNNIVRAAGSAIRAQCFSDTYVIDNTITDSAVTPPPGASNDHVLNFDEIGTSAPANTPGSAKVLLQNNSIQFSGPENPGSSLAIFSARNLVTAYGTRTNSTKLLRVTTLVASGDNDFHGFFSALHNSPETFLDGTGRRDFHGQQNPEVVGSTRQFMRGDRCWNTNAVSGSPLGWVCTVTGAPGVWKPMGTIES